MKLILLILVTSIGLIGSSSRAGDSSESYNGHLIPEPKLHDYVKAERTPGFSPITEIQDNEGRILKD
jgi:hypothetical protein